MQHIRLAQLIRNFKRAAQQIGDHGGTGSAGSPFIKNLSQVREGFFGKEGDSFFMHTAGYSEVSFPIAVFLVCTDLSNQVGVRV